MEQIEAGRERVASDLRNLARSADIPSRVRRHLAQNPDLVAAGTTVIGFVGSLLLPRSRRRDRRRDRGLFSAPSWFSRLIAMIPSLVKEWGGQRGEEKLRAFSRAAKAFWKELN